VTNRVIAIIALIGFAAFVGMLPLYLPIPDLTAVAVISVGLAAYDFWRDLFRKNGG
jgi:hypothetical protein